MARALLSHSARTSPTATRLVSDLQRCCRACCGSRSPFGRGDESFAFDDRPPVSVTGGPHEPAVVFFAMITAVEGSMIEFLTLALVALTTAGSQRPTPATVLLVHTDITVPRD